MAPFSWFDPVDDVALELLGATISFPDGVRLLIVEVEAYGGAGQDAASHAHRGPTTRNRSMFGPPGRLYVYRSYGVHHCVNVVCGREGTASAVLLRAAEVLEGTSRVRERRGPSIPRRDLARGPGRLGQAAGITLGDDGRALDGSEGILLEPAGAVPDRSSGPRVGIRRAAGRPWRFWITGHPAVSAYRSGRA